jgi:hypothetical protein
MASSYERWAGPRARTLAAEKRQDSGLLRTSSVSRSPAVSQTDTQRSTNAS